MPTVNGVLETALFVDDLERSHHFYQKIFDFNALTEDAGRLIALGVGEQQVLLLARKGASTAARAASGGKIPPFDSDGTTHLAFSVPSDQLAAWKKWLNRNGIAIESEVAWERGGRSLYFRDPDGHLLELATPGVWSIY